MCQAKFTGAGNIAKGQKRTHAGEHLEGVIFAVK